MSKTAEFEPESVRAFHSSFENYRPTPLVSLPALAGELGVGEILVKDESKRFDLNAFKILGASYGIYRFVKKGWEAKTKKPLTFELFHGGVFADVTGRFTFCTASDGNHGRAVAWMARHTGQKAVIYLPAGTAGARVESIEKEGAEARVVDGNYDQAVIQAAFDAKRNGWQIISDTSYESYTQIPLWIISGYATLFSEVDEAAGEGEKPEYDIVLLQSGVGALAAAAVQYYYGRAGLDRPRLISVEPVSAACLLESFRSTEKMPVTCQGNLDSIMAGLNCGRPSLVAWPYIRQGMDMFLAISDALATEAMRRFYKPLGKDNRVISGESGAAGLAGLLALCRIEKLQEAKEALNLSEKSRILLINTEGATDPVSFSQIVGE